MDPRTARRVPLWQELSRRNATFPGDPGFTFRTVATIPASGYLLEQITSLGTHTGTHISAPAHFINGAPFLSQLDEGWTLMPLVVIDVRARMGREGGDFSLDVSDLRRWERRHGRIPRNGCVLLLSGFSSHYSPTREPGPVDDYFDPAPGFTAGAVSWLFDHRGIRAVGARTLSGRMRPPTPTSPPPRPHWARAGSPWRTSAPAWPRCAHTGTGCPSMARGRTSPASRWESRASRPSRDSAAGPLSGDQPIDHRSDLSHPPIIPELRHRRVERMPVLRRLSSMNPLRPLASAMLFVAVIALAGCASSSAGATVESNGGSCAVVIEIGGTSYIGGRHSQVALPLTTKTFPARRAKCPDAGDGPRGMLIATKIRGIAVGDAVATDGYQLMLAERLWRVDWAHLPKALQPYVRR